jgi:protein-tyrosine phosphatase
MRTDFEIIDVHAHVLPGLDDGPEEMAESLRMCELWAGDGVSAVVATPHLADRRFDVTPHAVQAGVSALNRACYQRGLELDVLPGGDVRLCPELLEMLDAGDVLTVGDAGRYLLLELPPAAVPPIEGLVGDLLGRGVTPVITHPERHPEFWRRADRLRELVHCGCLLQLTGASLLGAFGRTVLRVAEWLVASGLVHVVASDAHAASGRRAPEMRRVADRLADAVGQAAARRLMLENPGAMVRGQDLDSVCRGRRRRRGGPPVSPRLELRSR